jgi:hypothetical protein
VRGGAGLVLMGGPGTGSLPDPSLFFRNSDNWQIRYDLINIFIGISAKKIPDRVLLKKKFQSRSIGRFEISDRDHDRD